MKTSVFNSLLVKLGTIAAGLALFVTYSSVNSACIMIMHQPQLPEGAKDLRRF